MFILVGSVPVIIPQRIRVPRVETKPLAPYRHSIDYHLLADNPHKVTRAMIGLHVTTGTLPTPTIKTKRKEVEMEGLNRIKYSSNWGGGSFEGDVYEGAPVTIVAKNAALIHGTLVKGKTIYGADHDHGHTQSWTFQDYNLVLPSDLFDRKSSLLEMVNDAVAIYSGHLLSEVTRYRDHRGSLEDSLETAVLLPRTMDALVSHLNTSDYLLHRKITADDLEFHQAGFDDRIGWSTVWVKLKGFGVLGCIDGEIK